jgi:probable rRNA maturation factor
MPHTVHVQIDEDFAGEVEPKLLRAAARAALAQQQAPAPGEVTLVVTDDRALRQLNRKFLKEDHATDVLSFPSTDHDPRSGARLFGDIVISFPRAAAQAAAGGHPLAAELQLLVVHGMLHLLGHDHARAGDKARMWAAQTEILTTLKSRVTGPAAE